MNRSSFFYKLEKVIKFRTESMRILSGRNIHGNGFVHRNSKAVFEPISLIVCYDFLCIASIVCEELVWYISWDSNRYFWYTTLIHICKQTVLYEIEMQWKFPFKRCLNSFSGLYNRYWWYSAITLTYQTDRHRFTCNVNGIRITVHT